MLTKDFIKLMYQKSFSVYLNLKVLGKRIVFFWLNFYLFFDNLEGITLFIIWQIHHIIYKYKYNLSYSEMVSVTLALICMF